MQRSVDPLERPRSDRKASAPGPELAVRTVGLTKSYRHAWTGRTIAGVEDLNLEVERGEILGCLGPNGAGKTTALKLLVGLLKPTRGNAWLMGEPVARVLSRRRLGFLPERPYFYEYLSGLEYLEFVGRLSGLHAQEARERARRWLGRVGLGERPQQRLRKYSKGMLQRLGLAAALLHEPDLLILDEPMSGLDPFGRRDVRDLIHEQRERGTTVLFSSHILPDVETLCDRVAILMAGRLTRVATVGEIVSDSRQRVEIRCAGVSTLEIVPELREVLVRQEHTHETLFVLEDDGRLDEVLSWLLRRGARIRAVTPQRTSLEDLFLEAAGTRPDPGLADRRTA